MVGFQLAENAGAMQEVVYQRVDRDHHGAGFDPGQALGITGQEQLRERHRQHLVRHAVDVPERLEQCLTQPRWSS